MRQCGQTIEIVSDFGVGACFGDFTAVVKGAVARE
jgi:hypothetical protein